MEARPIFQGAVKLVPDVLGGQLYIEHGGVDVSVSHEAHEGRQRDSGPHHVRAEGVAEAMRIGL
jgi:hypothetical protein